MNRAQNTTTGAADRLFGVMKQNPEALLLLAAGCAMLMRSTSAKTAASAPGDVYSSDVYSGGGYSDGAASRAAGAANQAAGAVSQAAGAVSQAADGMRQYTADAAAQARESVAFYASAASTYAQRTGNAIGQQSQQAFEQTQSALQGTLDRVLRDQPLMVAFAGLAAGAAVAASFAPTDIERKALGPVGERVSEAAADVGERLKDAAAEASDALKQSAERRGMTPESLKEMASEAGDAFSSRMSGSAKQDKPTAAPQGNGTSTSERG